MAHTEWVFTLSSWLEISCLCGSSWPKASLEYIGCSLNKNEMSSWNEDDIYEIGRESCSWKIDHYLYHKIWWEVSKKSICWRFWPWNRCRTFVSLLALNVYENIGVPFSRGNKAKWTRSWWSSAWALYQPPKRGFC